MSKFSKPFIEEYIRIYAPEGSPLFEMLLDRRAYQQGLKDGLSLKHQKDARKRLQKVNKGGKDDQK